MEGTVLTLTFGITAAVFVSLAIPLIRRKVRPNPFYGFRTPSTMRDERLWYEVNARAGQDLLIIGGGLAGATVVHAVGILPEPPFLVVSLGWTILGVGGIAVHGFAIISRWRA